MAHCQLPIDTRGVDNGVDMQGSCRRIDATKISTIVSWIQYDYSTSTKGKSVKIDHADRSLEKRLE